MSERDIYPNGRHDNDAERISEISVLPTAEELMCKRPPYLPPNALSTWENIEQHLKVGPVVQNRRQAPGFWPVRSFE